MQMGDYLGKQSGARQTYFSTLLPDTRYLVRSLLFFLHSGVALKNIHFQYLRAFSSYI